MRPMELGVARADSRAAYPCLPTRRFGEAAGAVENHCPVGSVGRPYCAGGKHQMCWCRTSLRAHCRGSSHLAITRCRDGSSPIASALAVSAPALFVSFSHHACRRDEALRSESTKLSDQITGLAAVAGFCPGHTCRTFFHTTRDAIAAHVDEGCTLQEKDLEVRPLCVFRLNQPLHAIVPATIRQPSTPPERSITTDTSDLQACDLPIFRLSVL